MSNFNNISVTVLDDGMVALHVDHQPISDRYEMKFEASIVDELKALATGQQLKLFEQFIFSHTDLNFEHHYQYVTAIVRHDQNFSISKNFVYIIKIEGQPKIDHVITKQGQPMTEQDVREFIQAHLEKSLTEYTDLKYAY
ncbi:MULTISPECIES: hypothetical protein [unclassified Acinetobacter]|uniref:hypothetical protein n=1 Tax=unclassified Acinetobacter TaxID=196816 RepID=UPI002934706F|nr:MULTISPECIES: hypothetical protein [unclassified Acinetobacter]WOE30808.1 hypothetical protein QSG84_10610 [Acinetobacter sp. SAAs470]WOE39003.1 hypothetical protein QSG86_04275 [Acinetobacter sp. SAAs474]